jgi:hypothetical protein
MRRTVSLSAAALFALALVTGPAAAQNAGDSDYSSGFGFLQEPAGNVGYELIGMAPGSPDPNPAQGQFDFRRSNRTGQGTGFHAIGVCIAVDGDEAVLGLRVTESNDPAYTVGEAVEAVALDGGDGNPRNNGNDRFHLPETSDDDPDEPDCETDEEADSKIRGDIVVEEGGFAPSQ